MVHKIDLHYTQMDGFILFIFLLSKVKNPNFCLYFSDNIRTESTTCQSEEPANIFRGPMLLARMCSDIAADICLVTSNVMASKKIPDACL